MADLAIVRVNDDTPPEMLEVLIAAECFRAKRCVPRCGWDEDHPSAYDLHHRRIDALLTELLDGA